jgi:hypothetical protein
MYKLYITIITPAIILPTISAFDPVPFTPSSIDMYIISDLDDAAMTIAVLDPSTFFVAHDLFELSMFSPPPGYIWSYHFAIHNNTITASDGIAVIIARIVCGWGFEAVAKVWT